ncbi:hypothetical protein RHSIM_Rhsim08G0138800 [Rhododendron simsii]|uniref:Uncharacterized protein n=1 Tax=Rhododendron simsii TaxID=118357 RepID=A0A834GMY6_RHOSS|nr:hypothetical protein RHSIM_Rhsim08G0138800 [Rhododendron simsii]
MIVKVLEPESNPPPGSPPPTPPSSTTKSSSTIGVAVKEAGIISSSATVVLTTMSFWGQSVETDHASSNLCFNVIEEKGNMDAHLPRKDR